MIICGRQSCYTRQRLTAASREVASNPSLNHDNKTLEVKAGIEVTCTKCYVKGVATAEVTIDGDFNATQLVQGAIDSVDTAVQNLTDQFEGYLDRAIERFNASDGIDASDFEYPTFELPFDLNVSAIPEANLRFQFDGMELYLEIGTVLSAGATYEITLFATQSPIGASIGQDLMLGAVLTVDLILAVEGAIDISSGFHVKLDDGVAINLPLFGDEVADMTV